MDQGRHAEQYVQEARHQELVSNAIALIQEKWSILKRLTTVEMLHQELAALSEKYQEDFHEKGALIQLLSQDIQDADEHFQKALNAHRRQTNELVEFHHQQQQVSLQQGFERDLQALQEEFNKERGVLLQQHEIEKAEVEALLSSMEEYQTVNDLESRHLQDQLRSTVRIKGAEALNNLRVRLYSQVERLKLQLEDVMASHHCKTSFVANGSTSSFGELTSRSALGIKILVSKDHGLTKQIEKKIRTIEQYLVQLKDWRHKMTTTGKEHSERNQALLTEKRAVLDRYQKLKHHMNKYCHKQKQHLFDLSQEANAAHAGLESQLQLGMRILHLAESAKKKEEEQEEVFKQLDTSPDKARLDRLFDEQATKNFCQQHSMKPWKCHDDKLSCRNPLQTSTWKQEGAINQLNHWDNFWKRYNKTLLYKVFLYKEKEKLEQENVTLQAVIKRYFDGITVNDEIMNASNPLLVVQGRRNDGHAKPSTNNQRRPNIIEGNHMVQTGRINTAPFFFHK